MDILVQRAFQDRGCDADWSCQLGFMMCWCVFILGLPRYSSSHLTFVWVKNYYWFCLKTVFSVPFFFLTFYFLLGVKAIFITVLKHTCTWVCSGVFQRQHDVQRMEGRDRECGIYMYTLLYLKWTANRDLLYITRNSAQCYVAACTGKEFRGEWIHVCVWLSPFAVYLKPLQQC